MSHQFAFLFADDSGNLKAADRKLIRSHCMKGINVRENSRRSLRQTRKERARQQDLSIDGPSTSGGAGESSSGALQVRESGAPSTQSHPRGDDYMSAPRPSPLNLSVLGFPGNLDSSCGELTFKCEYLVLITPGCRYSTAYRHDLRHYQTCPPSNDPLYRLQPQTQSHSRVVRL